MAEAVGFEPTERSRVRRISSALPSTARPRFRCRAGARPDGTEPSSPSPGGAIVACGGRALRGRRGASGRLGGRLAVQADRKSTRLNSSHVKISYAVFCLKKKTRKVI